MFSRGYQLVAPMCYFLIGTGVSKVTPDESAWAIAIVFPSILLVGMAIWENTGKRYD